MNRNPKAKHFIAHSLIQRLENMIIVLYIEAQHTPSLRKKWFGRVLLVLLKNSKIGWFTENQNLS
jgi:hypothetical protein